MNGLLAAQSQESPIGDARSPTHSKGETSRRNPSLMCYPLPEMNGRRCFSEDPWGGKGGMTPFLT